MYSENNFLNIKNKKMKKVILTNQNEEYIESKGIDNYSHIGIIWEYNKPKNWIAPNGNGMLNML